jgi:hypothetical protein
MRSLRQSEGILRSVDLPTESVSFLDGSSVLDFQANCLSSESVPVCGKLSREGDCFGDRIVGARVPGVPSRLCFFRTRDLVAQTLRRSLQPILFGAGLCDRLFVNRSTSR